MHHNKELIIGAAIDLQEWHFMVPISALVISSENERSSWLHLRLDVFKVHPVEFLEV